VRAPSFSPKIEGKLPPPWLAPSWSKIWFAASSLLSAIQEDLISPPANLFSRRGRTTPSLLVGEDVLRVKRPIRNHTKTTACLPRADGVELLGPKLSVLGCGLMYWRNARPKGLRPNVLAQRKAAITPTHLVKVTTNSLLILQAMWANNWNFFFFIFSFLFLQKYMVRKHMQNYTSSAVGDGGRDYRRAPRR
jgi:hypothetical protein